MTSLTTAGALLAAAGTSSCSAPGTLLATACMTSLTAAGTLLVAVATTTEADAFAAEAAEAIALVHSAVSIIVGAAPPVVRTATGRALRRFIGGLVHVFVTIAHAAVAACRSDPIIAE